MSRRGSLDPETYQRRDIKRRVSTSERHLKRLLARIEAVEDFINLHLDLPPESVAEK